MAAMYVATPDGTVLVRALRVFPDELERQDLLRCVRARRRRRFAECLQQEPRELRSLAGFFVFEVDVDVTACGGVGADHAGPAPQVFRCITLIAQPEVAVARGDL